MNRLENKSAIVTGASSGIGRGIALAFSKEGANVVVADINEQGGKETVKLIKKEKGSNQAVFIKTDVSRAEDINNMVQTCLDSFGRIDILVNNAGILMSGPLHEMKEQDWDKILSVNLKSVFLASKRVIPGMLKQGKGKIINTTSIAGLIGFNELGAYCATKGGIIALSKSMAIDYAPSGININCIAPGVIRTQMTKAMLEDPAIKKTFALNTPYPRFGEPKDIAMAAVYLASDESDFVVGHVLTVDGGYITR